MKHLFKEFLPWLALTALFVIILTIRFYFIAPEVDAAYADIYNVEEVGY